MGSGQVNYLIATRGRREDNLLPRVAVDRLLGLGFEFDSASPKLQPSGPNFYRIAPPAVGVFGKVDRRHVKEVNSLASELFYDTGNMSLTKVLERKPFAVRHPALAFLRTAFVGAGSLVGGAALLAGGLPGYVPILACLSAGVLAAGVQNFVVELSNQSGSFLTRNELLEGRRHYEVEPDVERGVVRDEPGSSRDEQFRHHEQQSPEVDPPLPRSRETPEDPGPYL